MSPAQARAYEAAAEKLRRNPESWLVTGVAGFIGSNVLQRLLELGQRVVGVDNFATGHRRNVKEVLQGVEGAAERFSMIEGDIADPEVARAACNGVGIVLHQAALGSVPRSLTNPAETNRVNVDGFLSILLAARETGIRRFVYASSSAVYGDHPGLPKREEEIGRPLSPYAVSKLTNELYAEVFSRISSVEAVGLRYFNVFGERQDPEGPYAAVIPRWIMGLLAGKKCEIHGDGETSRDFCFVENAVQANILAALAPGDTVRGRVYNVAASDRTSLNELFALIRDALSVHRPDVSRATPAYTEFRPGDIRHSQADISRARAELGYAPTHDVAAGMARALPWYLKWSPDTGSR